MNHTNTINHGRPVGPLTTCGLADARRTSAADFLGLLDDAVLGLWTRNQPAPGTLAIAHVDTGSVELLAPVDARARDPRIGAALAAAGSLHVDALVVVVLDNKRGDEVIQLRRRGLPTATAARGVWS